MLSFHTDTQAPNIQDHPSLPHCKEAQFSPCSSRPRSSGFSCQAPHCNQKTPIANWLTWILSVHSWLRAKWDTPFWFVLRILLCNTGQSRSHYDDSPCLDSNLNPLASASQMLELTVPLSSAINHQIWGYFIVKIGFWSKNTFFNLPEPEISVRSIIKL